MDCLRLSSRFLRPVSIWLVTLLVLQRSRYVQSAFTTAPTGVSLLPARSTRWSTYQTTALYSSSQKPDNNKFPVVVKPRKEGKAKDGWSSLKDTIYETMDSIQSIPNKISSITEKDEQTVDSSYGQLKSPGERVMKDNDESPPAEGKRSFNFFDSVKEGIYESVDKASELFTKSKPKDPTETETPVSSALKPIVRENPGMRELQLASGNPIRKWFAERQIQLYKAEERRRQEALEREQYFNEVKESFYQFVDACSAFATTVKNLPSKTVETATETRRVLAELSEWAASVPGKVESAVETVKAIPNKIQKKANEVQDSVESAVETTKTVVKEVQTLPDKVEKGVKGTSEMVDEMYTSAKVFIGAEKAKPRPPKVPPPKDPSAPEMAQKVAGDIAVGTAKVAWSLGKEVAALSMKGAQFAFDKGSEVVAEQLGKSQAATTKTKSPKAKGKRKPAAAPERKSAADLEAEKALSAYESAMKFVEDDDEFPSLLGNRNKPKP